MKKIIYVILGIIAFIQQILGTFIILALIGIITHTWILVSIIGVIYLVLDFYRHYDYKRQGITPKIGKYEKAI